MCHPITINQDFVSCSVFVLCPHQALSDQSASHSDGFGYFAACVERFPIFQSEVRREIGQGQCRPKSGTQIPICQGIFGMDGKNNNNCPDPLLDTFTSIYLHKCVFRQMSKPMGVNNGSYGQRAQCGE